MNLKKSYETFYAMRVIQKDSTDYKATELNIEKVIKERDIGLLGKECCFLVQTFATFESEVNNLI